MRSYQDSNWSNFVSPTRTTDVSHHLAAERSKFAYRTGTCVSKGWHLLDFSNSESGSFVSIYGKWRGQGCSRKAQCLRRSYFLETDALQSSCGHLGHVGAFLSRYRQASINLQLDLPLLTAKGS